MVKASLLSTISVLKFKNLGPHCFGSGDEIISFEQENFRNKYL